MLREADLRAYNDHLHPQAPQAIDPDSDFDEAAAREVDAVTDVDPSEIDDESLCDFESPADGYFQRRSHPRQVFVENPLNAGQAEADAKAREAQDVRFRSAAAGPTSYIPQSSMIIQPEQTTPAWPTHEGPVLDGGPAPPDYAAATADRNSESEPSYPSSTSSPRRATAHPQRNYGSIEPDAAAEPSQRQWPFGNQQSPFGPEFPFGPSGSPFGPSGSPFGHNGVFGRNGLFQDSSQPQSMRDPMPASADPAQPDEETGLLIVREERPSRPNPRWVKRSRRRSCASWCSGLLKVLIGIMIVLGIAFIIALVDGAADGRHNTNPDQSKSPIEDPKSGDDSNAGDPMIVPSPVSPDLSLHRSTRQCQLAHVSESSTFIFSASDSFLFAEAIRSTTDVHLRSIRGQVHMQPAQSVFDGNIRVNISVATASPWLPVGVTTKDEPAGLHLRGVVLERYDTKGLIHSDSNTQACVDVVVTIEIQPGLTLRDWRLSSTYLNINASEHLFDENTDARYRDSQALATTESPYFYISDSSQLFAEVGNINVPYWSSRDTDITTTTGDIAGTFALYDSLSIHSETGAVKVDVRPQTADPNHPKPAFFSVSARTGDIGVRFPNPRESEIPVRDYRTQIAASTSAVHGDFILGTQTDFELVSGSLQARLLPIAANYSGCDEDWSFAQSNRDDEDDDDDDDDFDERQEPGPLDLDISAYTGAVTLTIDPIYQPHGGALHRTRPSHSKLWTNSHHKFQLLTGSLDLTYPEEWTGSVEGVSQTGSIAMRGRDVKIVNRERVPGVATRVLAEKRVRKDVDFAKIEFHTQSGSTKLLLGDDV